MKWFLIIGFALSVGVASSAPAKPPARVRTPTVTVDLNTASEPALLRIPGIGPVRAKAILERRAKRRFKTIEELRGLRGFGPKLVWKLRPWLRAGP